MPEPRRYTEAELRALWEQRRERLGLATWPELQILQLDVLSRFVNQPPGPLLLGDIALSIPALQALLQDFWWAGGAASVAALFDTLGAPDPDAAAN